MSKKFTHVVYNAGLVWAPELDEPVLTYETFARAYQRYSDDMAHQLHRQVFENFNNELLWKESFMRSQVYIAGPMRGLPDYNFPAFYQAEAMLELWGFRVHNPARMDITANKAGFNRATATVIPDTSFKITEVLRRDFDAIKQCDAIVVLPGWEKSMGAQREIAFAQSIGIPVYRYIAALPLDLETQQPLNLDIQITITEGNNA